MPPLQEIQTFLHGAWLMMLGRKEGISMLDLSAEGFWNSFHAILVAAPPLFLGWVLYLRMLDPLDLSVATRLYLLMSMALIDLAAWIVPIAGLALIARRVGIAQRFVHYVVATNWAMALMAWIYLPVLLLMLAAPGLEELEALLTLGLLLASIVLFWRLTHLALNSGPVMATAVLAGMGLASFTIAYTLDAILIPDWH